MEWCTTGRQLSPSNSANNCSCTCMFGYVVHICAYSIQWVYILCVLVHINRPVTADFEALNRRIRVKGTDLIQRSGEGLNSELPSLRSVFTFVHSLCTVIVHATLNANILGRAETFATIVGFTWSSQGAAIHLCLHLPIDSVCTHVTSQDKFTL